MEEGITELCCYVNPFISCTLCNKRWCNTHWHSSCKEQVGHYWYKCNDTSIAVKGLGMIGQWLLVKAK